MSTKLKLEKKNSQ